jgi:hypothetical protein
VAAVVETVNTAREQWESTAMTPHWLYQARWERMEPATPETEPAQEQEAVERMAAEAATDQQEIMEPREDMQVRILSARAEQPTMGQAQHQEAQHRPIMTQA